LPSSIEVAGFVVTDHIASEHHVNALDMRHDPVFIVQIAVCPATPGYLERRALTSRPAV
jgi:hypothetical protein